MFMFNLVFLSPLIRQVVKGNVSLPTMGMVYNFCNIYHFSSLAGDVLIVQIYAKGFSPVMGFSLFWAHVKCMFEPCRVMQHVFLHVLGPCYA
jgi:hypothetical protein